MFSSRLVNNYFHYFTVIFIFELMKYTQILVETFFLLCPTAHGGWRYFFVFIRQL